MRTALDQVTSTTATGYSFPEQGDWFVLHTRSRQEKIVAQQLMAMGVGGYLPLVRLSRIYGTRKCLIESPLFPGYVFLRGTLDEAYAIDRTDRIAQVIRVPDQEILEKQLRAVDRAQMGGGDLRICAYMARGMLVQVCSGPFSGLQGTVDSSEDANRLILKVDVLGRAVSLSVDAALLTPISAG